MLQSQQIKSAALALNFDACGIVRVEPVDAVNAAAFLDWIDNDRCAAMSYLRNNIGLRLNPQQWWAEAQSMAVLLWQYLPQQWQNPDLPQVACFAYGEDYHIFLRKKLRQLLQMLQTDYPALAGRISVDSSPVLERYWAVQAGLGFIGKNSTLINPHLGSFVFIGILALNEMVDTYDNPMPAKDCGNCCRCIEVCPANAIVQSRTIDARRCISYLTQYGIGAQTHDYIWGCDICQRVCPHNQNAAPKNNKEWRQNERLLNMTAEYWQNMEESEFAQIINHSSIKSSARKNLNRQL